MVHPIFIVFPLKSVSHPNRFTSSRERITQHGCCNILDATVSGPNAQLQNPSLHTPRSIQGQHLHQEEELKTAQEK